ncbi:Ubiquinone biosynthesis protein [Malassezia yamatoensis]|uniref:4-hydroxy-3-methoxy-5-polyprenylbenzoate decarboxylase n=1 Tax=Malassezia yamatoensis TaxID=253288 RepID=A0AAJ6CKD8_9BASI|nr:Ubiquinone biosynthesis protein [Malassezia yamatoensis]
MALRTIPQSLRGTLLVRPVIASGYRVHGLHTTVSCLSDRHAHEEHERDDYAVPTPFWERALLGVGSALGLLVNPSRGDLLSVLTQVSSFPNIDRLVTQMRSTHEGRKLLVARPSINSRTINLDSLWALPDHTFGKEWVRWLRANRVGPDGRSEARHMPTLETRYVIQRYRETHDFYHVLLGMPTTTLGETVVKYFEAAHMHLPVAALSAVGGSLRLQNDDWRAHWHQQPAHLVAQLRELAPWAWHLGRNVRVPLISVNWEQRFDQPLSELRSELGLDQPPPVKLDVYQAPPRMSSKARTQVAGRRFYGWPSKVWERHGNQDERSILTRTAHDLPSEHPTKPDTSASATNSSPPPTLYPDSSAPSS